mmetsp:Transcript_31483/g.46444  ORF Transcript_31483/g.46444 Transcript_31483/m.46444 type:complete len:103 (-) Transcript_31483:37-345(-)
MSEEPRILEGFKQCMPTVGETGDDAAGKDYIIVGRLDSWHSPPQALKIIDLALDKEEARHVLLENFNFMSRGWKLNDGTYYGEVTLENEEVVDVKIQITSVH